MEALLQDKNLKRICVLILVSLWAWSVLGAAPLAGDSLGLKSIEGKSFIIYQVDKGETAYAVSRKYSVPFKEIAAANNGVDMGALKAGQQILVPVVVPIPETVTATVDAKTKEPAPSEIKEETPKVETPVEIIPEEKTEIVEPTPVEERQVLSETDLAVVAEENDSPADKSTSFSSIYASYQSTEMIAAFEKGVATWIENNGIETSGDRFYVLHNSAPIGSIVKVRNMMNNRVIYAKVIGRLSESEVNSKVMIKLSAGAGERLNVLDNRFVVEITYYMDDTDKASN